MTASWHRDSWLRRRLDAFSLLVMSAIEDVTPTNQTYKFTSNIPKAVLKHPQALDLDQCPHWIPLQLFQAQVANQLALLPVAAELSALATRSGPPRTPRWWSGPRENRRTTSHDVALRHRVIVLTVASGTRCVTKIGV